MALDLPAPAVGAERVMLDASVLVIDDVAANVLLLEKVLTGAGVGTVLGCTDPSDGLARFPDLQPDLVICDLHMPHMDGVAVIEALLALIPEDDYVPIVILTADTTSDAMRRALTAGARDFITKPFEHDEVLLRVKNLLETRALHMALREHNRRLEAELRDAEAKTARIAEEHQRRTALLRGVIDSGAIHMVFQPIVSLSDGRTRGFEALARFPVEPCRPPNEWFDDAAGVGLGTELELLAVHAAVAELDRLPSGAYLSVNVSPSTALDSELRSILAPVAHRIVLELTEHARVADYDDLHAAIERVRRIGIRMAVDDAGAGYANLRHILRLRPDIIKLDIDLTRGVDADPARRALAASLVSFAAEIGADITAEGIETRAELDALRRLGVDAGQGYYLGRPEPVDAMTEAASATGWNRAGTRGL